MADPVTVAAGVTRCNCHWGYYLEGTKDALLAAGLARPEWFLDGRERNKRGKVIRTTRHEDEDLDIECTQPARGLCTIRFEMSWWCNTERFARYDGNKAVAWAECAWQPGKALGG